MGEKNITTTVKIDGEIEPDFSYDWAVVFKGEKYIMPLRIPQGGKDNESMLSSIDLTFQHWAIYQLKRRFFFAIINLESDTVLPDQYEYPISLNLGDLCILFNKVLKYLYGDRISLVLNPNWEYSEEPQTITISHTKVWGVLTQLYELYGVRWQIEPSPDNDNEIANGEKYVIKVGFPTTEITHIFEHGFEGGLLKVERQVQDDKICNMIIGRGGKQNLPYRYFKEHDENNITFLPDPDWVPELKDRYFSNLHGATFRSYIQGWNHKHYKRTDVTSDDKAYAPWAWMRGYTDKTFNPVEYIADEYTTEENGYAVRSESSIAKYGELEDGLENNEDIYPTIQGVTVSPEGRIDQVVDVEPITSDDIETSAESDAQIKDLSAISFSSGEIPAHGRKKITESFYANQFTVPTGMYADLDEGVKSVSLYHDAYNLSGKYLFSHSLNEAKLEIEDVTLSVVDVATAKEYSPSGIPAGRYYIRLSLSLHNISGSSFNAVISCESPKLIFASPTSKWTNTWDVWIKNVWQTAKRTAETSEEYSERIWRPKLGDQLGNEAKMVFSSGWLSTSEDYEFVIVSMPTYDVGKTLVEKDKDGNVIATYRSHWKLTLAKCDAELESTGLYLPSTMRQANAGDYFFFTGIDMPHRYVVEAEKRLDDWKKDELAKRKEIKPSWAVSLDKVRMFNRGESGAIIESLHPGDTFTLRDKRFIAGTHTEKLYLTSITYTYAEPTDKEANLLPDIEVVLSDSYTVSTNPVSTLQGEVSAIQKQISSISNVEQFVRAVGDELYLRKDGFPERSYSPTEFASLLTSADFRNGIIGGAGWGVFKDENGNWVIEADRINARQDFQVNNLVINQIISRGGTVIESAAQMEIADVAEIDTGFICYFDQKNGSVANLFQVDDVAYCNRFTPENNELKFYKRRVVSIGLNHVVLSDTDKNGNDIPEKGDIIVHYGNYRDETRRYVIVRDVVNGGYERFIEGLDSVNANGVEYYFVGRQAGMYNNRPRWYVGDKNGYIEWVNGDMNVKCRLNTLSTINGKVLGDIVSATDEALTEAQTLYIQSASRSAKPDLPLLNADGNITDYKGWSTDAPSWQADLYIWQVNYTRRGDGTGSFSECTCISGRDGQNGKDGQGYATNMLRESNAPINRLTYYMGAYGFDVIPEPGKTYTLTVGYHVADKDDLLSAWWDEGWTKIGELPKGESVKSLKVEFPTGALHDNKGIAFFRHENDGVFDNETCIKWATLTEGDTPQTTWTPSASDMEGKPGEPAVTYTLLPSVNSVSRYADGALSEATVSCTVLKTTGAEEAVGSNELTLRYRREPDEAIGLLSRTNGVSSDVQLLPETTAVEFELFNGNIVYARERIAVFTDARDMSMGGENLLLNTGLTSFDNWSRWAWDDNSVRLDTTDRFNGAGVMKIDASGFTSWRGLGLWQNIELNPYLTARPNEYYILSVWVYTPDINSLSSHALFLGGGAKDSDGNMVTSAIGVATPTANNVWQRKMVMFKTASNATEFDISIYLNDNGKVWLSQPMLTRGTLLPDWAPSSHDFNYLTEALKNSGSFEGGLMLGSLIKLGYENTSGNRVTTAGVNGLLDATKQSRDIAFWAGGEMIDAEANESSNDSAASYLIRHDGTGYFAKKSIRVLQDKITVGDNVLLNKDGLHLVVNGNDALVISNKPIDVDFNKLSDNSVEISHREAVSVPIHVTGKYALAIRTDTETTLGEFTVSRGSTGSCEITASAYYSFTNISDEYTIVPEIEHAFVELRLGSTVIQRTKILIEIFERTDFTGVNPVLIGYRFYLHDIFQFSCEEGGNYTITLIFPQGTSVMDGASAGSLPFYVIADGTVKDNLGNQTVLGSDGFSSVWGDTGFAINHSCIIFRAGSYGLRITPAGIQKTTNSGSDGWPSI